MGIHDTTKDITEHMEYLMSSNESGSLVEEQIEEAAQEFAEHYHQLIEISQKYHHSHHIKRFADRLVRIGEEHPSFLDKIQRRNDPNHFTEQLYVNDRLAFALLYSVAEQVQEAAQEILTQSMASHMNFKSLTYHYSYAHTYRTKVYNTFQLLESGILLDVAL